jgi:peptidoglycan hydrolase-like protein with peptidoglycan-binding domain
VIDFQRRKALQVDGMVGPQTLAVLKATSVSQPTSFVEDLYFVDLDPAQYTGLNVRHPQNPKTPII